MRRREFLGLLGGAVAWPLAARAQTPGRVYRIGVLSGIPEPIWRQLPQGLALLDELRRAGFVEGQNLAVLDQGFGIAEAGLAAAAAAALVKAAPDAILAATPRYARAALGATRTIPITMMASNIADDGLSTSLARPDGNVTGFSQQSPSLNGKRGDLLAEAVPGLRRMAALAESKVDTPAQILELTDLAKSRGVELELFFVKAKDEIAPALDAAKASGAGAINVLSSALFYYNHIGIIERVQELRLPAIYEWPEWAAEGALIAYGTRFADIYRVMGRQLVKILRGAAVPDIPIEQPTKFELAINMKTARALGLEIPAMLLASADEVIE